MSDEKVDVLAPAGVVLRIAPETEISETDPVTIALRHPIQFGSQTIAELVFQPMTAKDKRAIRTDTEYGFEMMYQLAGRLSGQPPGVIDKLVGSDCNRVEALMKRFLVPGDLTGSGESL